MTSDPEALGCGSGYTLYSRLAKTTAEKSCFSKSGDIVSIPHATA